MGPAEAECSGSEPVPEDSARGRGWPLRATSLSVSLPIVALNYWIKGERKTKSRPVPGPHPPPARPDRLSLPACSLTLTQTHTEHSSWEPRKWAAGCAPKKLQSSLLFLGGSADGGEFPISPCLVFLRHSFTCCLFLSCSHVNARRRAMSVPFSSHFHRIISLPVLWRKALFFFILLFTKQKGL